MAVTTTLTTNNAMNAYTTVSLTALPTAFAPPRLIVRPRKQATRPAIRPNSAALTHEMITSGTPVNSVMPAANAPGFTSWTNTEKT